MYIIYTVTLRQHRQLICLISKISLNTGSWTICVQPLKLHKTVSVQLFELFMSHIWHLQDLDTFK